MVSGRAGLAVAAALLLVGAGAATPAVADADDEFAVVPAGQHVEASVDDGAAVESALVDELDVDRRDVRADADANTVEVLVGDVSTSEFVDALDAAGIEASENDVRDRPTLATVERFGSVLSTRYESAGVEANVTVREDRLVVNPGDDAETAKELASVRGVELWATVPTKDGTTAELVLTGDDVATVESVQKSQERAYVPVELTEPGAESFQASMQEYGFTQADGVACDYDVDEPLGANLQGMDADERCLLTRVGDEVVYASGVSTGLAESFRTGEFAADPKLRLGAQTEGDAEKIEHLTRSGSLPAETTVTATDDGSLAESGRAVTSDGAGFGPLAALAGVVGALLLARVTRR
ncbi:hypothetical protein HWV07_17960 [Natronomonas salina]|uniref:hypothetical protein n=1 Tax=Natronomonas salina TaxID=1710540 RepID=UPI0015B541CB|nr:hypothetical protein [Natronomonas salina]QLD90824.1 hypothetical protein HWV07_17960 [Natronomonas salina]